MYVGRGSVIKHCGRMKSRSFLLFAVFIAGCMAFFPPVVHGRETAPSLHLAAGNHRIAQKTFASLAGSIRGFQEKPKTCPISKTKPQKNPDPGLLHCRWYQDYSCCSNKDSIEVHKSVIRSFGLKYQKCPGCLHNIEVLRCALACSPSQEKFVSYSKPASKKSQKVLPKLTIRVCHSFCLDLFRSCAGVLSAGSFRPKGGAMGAGKKGESLKVQESPFRQDLTSLLHDSARFCEQQVSAGEKFNVEVVDDLDKASNSEHLCIGQFDMHLIEPVCDPYEKKNDAGMKESGTLLVPWRYEVSVVLAFFVVLGAVICAGYAMYRVQMNAKEMEFRNNGADGPYRDFQEDLSPLIKTDRKLYRARQSYYIDERDAIDESSGLMSAEL